MDRCHFLKTIRGAFDSDSTLFVVGFTRFGLEGRWDEFIDALFSKVERHKNVVRVDGFSNPNQKIIQSAAWGDQ